MVFFYHVFYCNPTTFTQSYLISTRNRLTEAKQKKVSFENIFLLLSGKVYVQVCCRKYTSAAKLSYYYITSVTFYFAPQCMFPFFSCDTYVDSLVLMRQPRIWLLTVPSSSRTFLTTQNVLPALKQGKNMEMSHWIQR